MKTPEKPERLGWLIPRIPGQPADQITLGTMVFRVLREHREGDVRAIDELELLSVAGMQLEKGEDAP